MQCINVKGLDRCICDVNLAVHLYLICTVCAGQCFCADVGNFQNGAIKCQKIRLLNRERFRLRSTFLCPPMFFYAWICRFRLAHLPSQPSATAPLLAAVTAGSSFASAAAFTAAATVAVFARAAGILHVVRECPFLCRQVRHICRGMP